MEARGQKYQFSNFLMNWGKFGSAICAFQKSRFSSFMNWENLVKIYIAQDQHFKIQILNLWMNWENLCPNLSFIVENKMDKSHKKVWSHFKLNMNDLDT